MLASFKCFNANIFTCLSITVYPTVSRHARVSGVPQNLLLLPFVDVLLHRVPKIVNFNQAGVPKGFREPKRLKTLLY
jgi:hypothetical protein